jgi:hypothetical protein
MTRQTRGVAAGGQDLHMDVDAVADDLYALPVEEFTAARDEQVAAARKAGDREQAAAIKALRRPSQSAWVVNQLARHRSADLTTLLDLGAALREAQATLAGDDLRALSGQRRSVVDALARAGRSLAAELGRPVPDAVEREVASTLDAALADPAAAAQVQAGRLVAPLHYSGFGESAPAGGTPKAPARKPAPTKAADDAERRRMAEIAEARAARTDTEKRAATAGAGLKKAMAQREAMVRRIAGLEEDLAHARRQDSAAADGVRAARKAYDDAERARNLARERHDRLEQNRRKR